MKKIIIFYPHIGEYGGIERNIIALVNEIKNRGQYPVLLCFYDKINLSNYSECTIDTVFIEDHWNPFVKSYRLRKWILKNSDSILGSPFVFGAKAGFYFGLAFLSGYVLHYTDPPSLLSQKKTKSFYYLFSKFRSMFSDAIMQLGVNRAKKRITMTNLNAIELKTIYNHTFEVIHQGGVPPNVNDVMSKKCANKKMFLFSICRITTSKNLDWIIMAVKDLVDNSKFNLLFDDIEVVIAGKGPDLKRLEQLSIEYDLQSVISFPGFLNNEELEDNFSKSDLFLVPGKQGYGLPILEALYRGVPVVMNVESRVSEILDENPWVAISDNSSSSFSEVLFSHIEKVKKEYPPYSFLETLPTESKWAISIGVFCEWWDNKI